MAAKVTDPNVLEMLNAPATSAGVDSSSTLLPGGGLIFTDIPEQKKEERSAAQDRRDVIKFGRDAAADLRKEFMAIKEVQEFRGIQNAARQIIALSEEETPAANMAMVFSFMKALDPNSTVREGEYASAKNTTSLPQKLLNHYNEIISGGFLSKQQLNDFADVARIVHNQRALGYNDLANTYRGLMQEVGADPDKQGLGVAEAFKIEVDPSAVKVAEGDKYVTDRDLEIVNKVSDVWANSSDVTVDAAVKQIRDIYAQYGLQPMSSEQEELLRSDTTRSLRWAPNPTGVRETGGLSDTLRGKAAAVASGAVKGYSAALGEEALSLLDPQAAAKLQAATEFGAKQSPVLSFGGELAGGIFSPLAKIGKGGTIAGEALRGGLYGTAYGAGDAPLGTDAMTRAQQALVTGAFGAGIGGAAQRYLGGRTPTKPSMGVAPVSQQARVIEAAQDIGVPVMRSDVLPPETALAKTVQKTSEVLPLGMGGPRRAQQKARQEAVDTLLGDMGVSLESDFAAEVMKDLTQTRSATVNRYNSMKTDVITRLSSAGDVPAPRAVSEIDNVLKDLQAENLPRENGLLIKRLEEVRKSLTGPGNLRKIENNRKTLFGMKKDPSLANVVSKTEGAFKDVYKAMNEDMGAFIQANGSKKDYSLWKVANTKLARTIGELEDGALKRVLNKGDFDPSQVAKMITNKNTNEAKVLFKNLSKSGRAKARLLLLQDAAQKSAKDGVINPSEFAKKVSNMKGNFDVFFTGPESRQVNALVDVLKTTARAQEANYLPRTGEMLFSPVALGGAEVLANYLGMPPGTGLVLSGGVGAVSRLLESRPVRDGLLRISYAKGAKKTELIGDLLEKIADMTPAAAPAVAGVQMLSPGQETPNIGPIVQ